MQQQVSDIDNLLKIISLEITTADSMLKALQDQQNSIVNFSGDALEVATERCNQISKKMKTIERDRIKIFERITKGTQFEKVSSKQITFEKYLDSLDNRGGLKVRLKNTRENLKKSIAEIIKSNTVNAMLLEHSINFAEKNIKAITSNLKKKILDKTI